MCAASGVVAMAGCVCVCVCVQVVFVCLEGFWSMGMVVAVMFVVPLHTRVDLWHTAVLVRTHTHTHTHTRLRENRGGGCIASAVCQRFCVCRVVVCRGFTTRPSCCVCVGSFSWRRCTSTVRETERAHRGERRRGRPFLMLSMPSLSHSSAVFCCYDQAPGHRCLAELLTTLAMCACL